MTPELYSSLSLATPELIVAIGAMALLMIGVYSRGNSSTLVTTLAVLVMLAAGAWIVLFTGDGYAFNNAFVSDPFARFMQVVTLVGSGVTLIMSIGFARSEKFDTFEYPVLVMLSTLGMMLMATANNLIALYICFELQSLALYIVAAVNRESLRSSEAGLKYFVLGALATGMMLYGISLVYGYTGSIDFATIRDAVGAERQVGVLFGLVFAAGVCLIVYDLATLGLRESSAAGDAVQVSALSGWSRHLTGWETGIWLLGMWVFGALITLGLLSFNLATVQEGSALIPYVMGGVGYPGLLLVTLFFVRRFLSSLEARGHAKVAPLVSAAASAGS